MIGDSTNLAYWVHWQVLLCAIWILFSMLLAAVLILKYGIASKREEYAEHSVGGTDASLYADQCWRPCLKQIHPAFLLLFRIIAFFLMSSVLAANIIFRGPQMFYFYTQWTFTLLTIYFGLGSVLSLYGCYIGNRKPSNGNDDFFKEDTERGTYIPPINGLTENVSVTNKQTERYVRQEAGIFGHVFQVLFQTCGGAVVLTDCVYWFIIFPFLTGKYYSLTFLMVCMHSINVLLLVVDTLLNCMWFQWHGIAYFILWTSMYVIFQWVLHACASLWWPYTFLDVSSPWAPLWYLCVGLLHIPCYAAFALVVKAKHFIFSRWFPESYQCLNW